MRTSVQLKRYLVWCGVCCVFWPGWIVADPAGWLAPALPEPRTVYLGGTVGGSLERGLARLARPPYSREWLLADVSFEISRIFTNYSGDVSGRFIELASLTSPPGQPTPPTLQPVLAEIARYQKRDGHFGADMDFSKPMFKRCPPIPMLWGNARLLVGLVRAAETYHNPELMIAAGRLGDFYLTTADVFCSPEREAELRATGTGGDGYACCYFPAIEGLALLYRVTRDIRYLQQAERMADWFKRFDTLPVSHSHGNLCAWRGILDLYTITGKSAYLERALAKWETAVQDGYVWPLGGVSEHWWRSYPYDEGCSQSDWLRLNLELWRHTGQTRFLDLAERVLLNQYAANQCPNGGYGGRTYDTEPEGAIAVRTPVNEMNFCCSFHGPLGLHFLKAYLAAGSSRGVFVNFPLDFDSVVHSGNDDWRVTLRTCPSSRPERREFDLNLAAVTRAKTAHTVLWLRWPGWAGSVTLTSSTGSALPFSLQDGYVRLPIQSGKPQTIHVAFGSPLQIERRGLRPVTLEPDRVSRFRDVTLLSGPEVLFASPALGTNRLTLLARVNAEGQLALWPGPESGWASLGLPGLDVGAEEIASFRSVPPVLLRPDPNWRRRRAAFVHDVLVIPDQVLQAKTRDQLARQVRQSMQAMEEPVFGSHLEQNPTLWGAAGSWHFATNGIHVTGGGIGLLEAGRYSDYLFEFELELPMAGQGMAGWVVRAAETGDCLHFQLQSADSTLNAPQYKTRRNTLRPHVHRRGEWSIADPVPLPKEVRRGETHHVAVECRGKRIAVFLDGEQVFTGDDAGLHDGTVGFRAQNPAEQGWFRNISLKKL